MPFDDRESAEAQRVMRNTRSSVVIVWMAAAFVICPVIALIVWYAIEYLKGE